MSREQLYLALGRDGIVHAARTTRWRFMLDSYEYESEAVEKVEQTVCDENDYFEEVFGVPITCVACATLVVQVEQELGLEWKQPP